MVLYTKELTKMVLNSVSRRGATDVSVHFDSFFSFLKVLAAYSNTKWVNQSTKKLSEILENDHKSLKM